MDEPQLKISTVECEILNEIMLMKELQPKYKINPLKLQYNEYYKSFEFWSKKFPKGYDRIPEINLVIKDIVEKNKTNSPLHEIIKLSEDNNINE